MSSSFPLLNNLSQTDVIYALFFSFLSSPCISNNYYVFFIYINRVHFTFLPLPSFIRLSCTNTSINTCIPFSFPTITNSNLPPTSPFLPPKSRHKPSIPTYSPSFLVLTPISPPFSIKDYHKQQLLPPHSPFLPPKTSSHKH